MVLGWWDWWCRYEPLISTLIQTVVRASLLCTWGISDSSVKQHQEYITALLQLAVDILFPSCSCQSAPDGNVRWKR